MRILLFVVASVALLISASNCEEEEERRYYEEKFIEVPLDHFNYVVDKTFKLRYLINDTFTANNTLSPILFYTGNEANIELFAQNTGALWDLAPHLNALIVFAEHRYYGKSLPFGENESLDKPEHFGYLSVEQALADFAQLVYALTDGRNDRPVIAVGGSYGGILAAWFRMKYPHFVVGALAASAPILQFPGLGVPCNVYTRTISAIFRAYNPNCSANIKRSWNVFNNFASTESGLKYLNEKLKFCNPLTKADDLSDFLEYLDSAYWRITMANYPYESNLQVPLPGNPVREFCSYLKDDLTDDHKLVEAMQEAIFNVYANYTGKMKCLMENHKTREDTLRQRAWSIQNCNELVIPVCSEDEENNMFQKYDWNEEQNSNYCYESYSIRPRPAEISARFGTDKLRSASNIIFSNGLLDVWSGAGVLNSANKDITIILIPEGAHHIDLRGANPKDPRSVRAARKLERDIIESWIRSYSEQRRF